MGDRRKLLGEIADLKERNDALERQIRVMHTDRALKEQGHLADIHSLIDIIRTLKHSGRP